MSIYNKFYNTLCGKFLSSFQGFMDKDTEGNDADWVVLGLFYDFYYDIIYD